LIKLSLVDCILVLVSEEVGFFDLKNGDEQIRNFQPFRATSNDSGQKMQLIGKKTASHMSGGWSKCGGGYRRLEEGQQVSRTE
jgi:hypothetical protein